MPLGWKDGYVEPSEINNILGYFDLHQDEDILKEQANIHQTHTDTHPTPLTVKSLQVRKMGKFGNFTVSLADFGNELVDEVLHLTP